MDAFEIEKEYWDDGPGIEAVSIHYLWTPVGVYCGASQS